MNRTLFFTIAVLASVPAFAGAEPAADPAALPAIDRALSLADAVALGRENVAAVRSARANAAAMGAQARSQAAMTKPGISTTTYATTGDSPNIFTTSPGVTPQNLFAVPSGGFADQNVTLMAPLFTGGRLGARSRAANLQAQGSVFGADAAALGAVLTVRMAYDNTLLQQALSDAAQARLDAEDEQVRVTQEKVTTGRSAPVDLLREQAEQADARQAVLAARNAAALAMADLKVALGVDQASKITLTDTLDNLAAQPEDLPGTLDGAQKLALANRPEVAQADRQASAAREAVKDAKGAYAPQVYGVAMGDATAMQGSSRIGYGVGVTVSLPLYDAGQRKADVDGAQAKTAQAMADEAAARQTVQRDVTAAWLALQTAQAQRDAAEAGLAAAQQGYDLETMRYNAGKAAAAERLDSLAALTRARANLAAAKAAILDARAQMARAVGNLPWRG
jgi:outer membrane protein TolC